MEEFDISKYIVEHGVKVSFQRMKILEYFVKFGGHPNVNDIYNYVIKEIPTLSKTTVYNTLNLFAKHDLIDIVTIEDNEVRYDFAPCIHGHFKCENCGTIADVNFDEKDIRKIIPKLNDFKIMSHHVNFKGLCKECNK